MPILHAAADLYFIYSELGSVVSVRLVKAENLDWRPCGRGISQNFLFATSLARDDLFTDLINIEQRDEKL